MSRKFKGKQIHSGPEGASRAGLMDGPDEGTIQEMASFLEMTAEYVQRISVGDIPPKINDERNGIFKKLTDGLNATIDTMNRRTAEFQKLVDASREGQLDYRADAKQFDGANARMFEVVNEVLDAILLPISEGTRVLRLIRGGNLREKVEIACKGDHEQMKNAINGVHAWLTDLIAYVTKIANGDTAATMGKASDQDQIHEWLAMLKNNSNALADDVASLAKAAVDGKLAIRADAAKQASALASSAEELTAVSSQMASNAEETATQANVVSAASEQVSKNVTVVASSSEQMQT